MKLVGVLLFVYFPYFVKNQVLLNPPPTLLINYQEDVELKCQFFPAIDGCYWLKDGGLIEIEDRYEYTGDLNDGDCSIRIKDVQPQDNGRWACGSLQTSSGRRAYKTTECRLVAISSPKPKFTFSGVGLDVGEKIYLRNYEGFDSLACSISISKKPEEIQFKWLNVNSNIQLPISTSSKKLDDSVYLISSNFQGTVSNTILQDGNVNIKCQVRILENDVTYETFVRLVIA